MFNSEDNSLTYSKGIFSWIMQNFIKIKQNEISILKIKISSFDILDELNKFSKIIEKIRNLKELELCIDVQFSSNSRYSKQERKDVLDQVIDSIIPKFQDSLESITFTEIKIEENQKKDGEQSVKKYLLKIIKPLNNLRAIGFRQSMDEMRASSFYGLKQFVLLLKKNSLTLPNLKLLDLEFQCKQGKANIRSEDKKEILNNMITIAKYISQIRQLEELQIGFQNLGLEKAFFQNIIQSIALMKNFKKLGIDISKNRINAETRKQTVKQLQGQSNQLEKLIYIDSQMLKKSNIKQFSQTIKSFQNLTFLQIEQFSFIKGHYPSFFEFLNFMPKLEQIKLDLETIKFNDNYYYYLVKQVKQLENLKLIELNLPDEKKILIRKHCIMSG